MRRAMKSIKWCCCLRHFGQQCSLPQPQLTLHNAAGAYVMTRPVEPYGHAALLMRAMTRAPAACWLRPSKPCSRVACRGLGRCLLLMQRRAWAARAAGRPPRAFPAAFSTAPPADAEDTREGWMEVTVAPAHRCAWAVLRLRSQRLLLGAEVARNHGAP